MQRRVLGTMRHGAAPGAASRAFANASRASTSQCVTTPSSSMSALARDGAASRAPTMASHAQSSSSSSFSRGAVAMGAIAMGGFACSAVALAEAKVAAADSKPKPTSAAHAALGGAKVTLYQYDVCPFCNKVKAFLDYHDVPYDVVEVNPLTKGELKFSKDGYSKVPIVLVGDEQLNDSTSIMRELTARIDANGTSWSGKKSKAYVEEERKWLAWVDERFVHVLTPNIYRTWAEAVKSFDYITQRGNFGFFERESARWVGAASMYVIAHRVLKKRHGIEDERADLYFEVNKFINEGVGAKKFCGGNAPNNADLAMFGVLRAVKTFETFKDVMDNTTCSPWYERMSEVVGQATRTDGVDN